MTEHYLDNSATTKPSDASLKAAYDAAAVWGNPSSVHAPGQAAHALLEESRLKIQKTFGMERFSKDRILLTSCGTESNNIAMLGSVRSKERHGGTVIISAGEHPSVDGPASLLEKDGFTLVRIPTAGGSLDLDFLEDALKNAQSPVLFSCFMLVNNETGALYDVKSANSMIKAAFPDAVCHCDAVQGYMKVQFTPASLGADTVTVSAHKIHAPRGAAALYVSENIMKRRNLTAVMPGGGQEGGFRSGTENLMSIAAFAAAAAEEKSGFRSNREKITALRRRLDAELSETGVHVNIPSCGIPDIASVTVPGIRSETVLNALSAKGIYVSAGSACSARSKKKSPALEAFGLSENDIDSTIRVSLSHTNTEEDIDAFTEALVEIMAKTQKKR